ncbi:MAG: aminotransferase class V-fold PLP-dependent enzyme [bacterium]
MVLPFTAHAAFYKAGHYLGVRPVTVPVKDGTFRADVDAMEAAIGTNTILLAASAPGYAHGVVDPIEEIGRLAMEKNLLFHVDACVGGIHLSYMRKLGMNVPEFDLSVPGVTSLSVDLHKYGYSAKNASLILYKNRDLRRYQIFACSRWPGYTVVNPTAGSSKTGGALAAAWATLNYLGDDGYGRIVAEVMGATRLVVEGIRRIEGLEIQGEPDMCMFSFCSTSDRLNVYRLADEMKARGGWYLQPQFARGNSRSNLHVSFTSMTVPRARELLADLEATVKDLMKEPAAAPSGGLSAAVENLDLKLDEETFDALLEMAGISGDEPPARMEEINSILEALPDDMTEHIVRTYINRILRQG